MKRHLEFASSQAGTWASRPGIDANLVDDMVALITAKDDLSTSQALAALRRNFPDAPLATRLTAIAALMKRRPQTPTTY